MAATRYRQFLKLIQRWPLDAKKGQEWDLGFRIREDVVAAFSEGERTIMADSERCDRIYESIDQLINNKHATDFPTKITAGAVCKNLEAAKTLTSEEARKMNLQVVVKIRTPK